jgi:hypothetical protein
VPDPGHLAEYVPDHLNGNIWNSYDLSNAAGGTASVTGTPVANNSLLLFR